MGRETRIDEAEESRHGVSLMPSERTLREGVSDQHSHMLGKWTVTAVTIDAQGRRGNEGIAAIGKWALPLRMGGWTHSEIPS